MESIRYITFSSGGFAGVHFNGVLDALAKHMSPEWHDAVQGVAGTSAGCFAALAFALRLGPEQRDGMVRKVTQGALIRNPDIGNFVDSYGVLDTAGMRDIASEMLSCGGLSTHATFADVRRLLRMEVVFVAANLDTGQRRDFSCTETPEVRIVDALCASCCVPIVFKPVVIQGARYVDGVLVCNDPAAVFPKESTLAVVYSSLVSPPTDWVGFMHALLRCATAAQPSVPHDHCIRITRAFEVQPDEARVKEMVQEGYIAAADFLTGGLISRATTKTLLHYMEVCTCPVLTAHDDEAPPTLR